MRPYAGWFAFVLLLGAVLGFAAGSFDRASTATAQTVDNRTTRWIGGTMEVSQAQGAFVLFDSQTNRLMAYTLTGGGRKLELLSVREISYDLKMATFGEQKPTVPEIRKAWEDSEREKDKEKDKNPK